MVNVVVMRGPGLFAMSVNRLNRLADTKRRRSAHDSLLIRFEQAPLKQFPGQVIDERTGRADDRESIDRVAEADRRHQLRLGLGEQSGKDIRLQEFHGRGLQIDDVHEQFGLAAGSADDEIETIGRPRASLAKRALLRRDGDAERNRQHDQADEKQHGRAIAAEQSHDDGKRVHAGHRHVPRETSVRKFHDRIGGADQVLVMGRHHHGAAVATGKIAQQRGDGLAGCPIEARRRLVGEDDRRIEHQAAGDRDPLLLAARQPVEILPLVRERRALRAASRRGSRSFAADSRSNHAATITLSRGLSSSIR